METNKKDPEAVGREIQDLKNKVVSIENKITTMQHIAARFSMRYGEDEEAVDKLENDIDELKKQIEYLTNSK
jgi:peptidoglycan hydrolase CwlO-like protein